MEDFCKQVPEGVADILIDECTVKREAEATIRDVFLSHGLGEVCTPTFEYLDVFYRGQGALKQEDMFKLTDPRGRLLVIRPDVTIPVARMVATNMKTQPRPLKLFYISDVFRVSPMGPEGQREFTQAGVELIGIPDAEADGECISTAIEALKAAGIGNLRLDVGQVEFFESIIDELDLSVKDKQCMRQFIKHKNLAAVEEFLDQKEINGNLKDLLLSVPVLYGNAREVLERAREFPLNDSAIKALYDIEKTCKVVEEYGYDECISVDLGMVRELSYYTGIIFKGFTRDLGYIICSGGRYDRLQGRFGEDLPATGFAINVNRVVQGLYNQNSGKVRGQKSFVLKCDDKTTKKAIGVAQKLRAAGFYIDLELSGKSVEDTIYYAGTKGVGGVILLKEGSRLKVIDLFTNKHSITSVPGIIARFSKDNEKCTLAWH